jgi:hypothetical protein
MHIQHQLRQRLLSKLIGWSVWFNTFNKQKSTGACHGNQNIALVGGLHVAWEDNLCVVLRCRIHKRTFLLTTKNRTKSATELLEHTLLSVFPVIHDSSSSIFSCTPYEMNRC